MVGDGERRIDSEPARTILKLPRCERRASSSVQGSEYASRPAGVCSAVRETVAHSEWQGARLLVYRQTLQPWRCLRAAAGPSAGPVSQDCFLPQERGWRAVRLASL
jgi:hypothetical protein